MSSKKKIAILIPASMLAMLLLISSSEVAASHSKEGEVVKITNEQGDAKFVGGGDLDVMVICFPPPPRYGRVFTTNTLTIFLKSKQINAIVVVAG
ncbi:hypothetical protein GLYMA_14G052300v4 [Glycine max]|nr:hypothetical protein GLYMA_14G052300v4 [Glycine max]